MKKIKNIVILLLVVAVLVAIVWLLPVKVLVAIAIFTQFVTLAAIGGTKMNKDNNDGHEQEEEE